MEPQHLVQRCLKDSSALGTSYLVDGERQVLLYLWTRGLVPCQLGQAFEGAATSAEKRATVASVQEDKCVALLLEQIFGWCPDSRSVH